MQEALKNTSCDLVVVGSGAGGLATAITAKKAGLDVVVIEKAPVFGGTTAFSGGILWIPQNGVHDTPDQAEEARQYLEVEGGNFFNGDAVDAYLKYGPEMVAFFQKNTEVQFVPAMHPDYHPELPGGVDLGRSISAKPYDASRLGKNLSRLRPPLATITFIGMMFNSGNADLKHFFNATRSIRSAAYVANRLASHMKDLVVYRRGVSVTSGNALVARLAKSAFDLDIPILTDTPATGLLREDGKVVGVKSGSHAFHAARGVVLATGGFPHDADLVAEIYPHRRRNAAHHSPTPDDNTGDGIRLARGVGGAFEPRFRNAASWMPVSLVPRRNGSFGVFPHLVDRYKPGMIAVLKSGKRFCNESNSYHDFGAALIEATEQNDEATCWLICNRATLRKYGLGYAKPAPVPTAPYVSNGYLKTGDTLDALAEATGIDATTLKSTVAAFDAGAAHGEDPEFGRGSTSFNRYLGDAQHQPNPNVGPVGEGPYYALQLYMGDLGTFDGLRTTVTGEVLNNEGAPIPGLYAVGNDRDSIMGGAYPGGGITLGPAMTFGYVTARHIAGIL
jgi:succinate dehydrogenase/fumarate reductase flavoprotein subunit